ncbi:MAG: hypothetical protein IJA18_04300 [Ruminococcus sp.]|nr:hypothetical protein [Ruminococcus sp.]
MKRILSLIAALTLITSACFSCGDTDSGTEKAENEEVVIPEETTGIGRQSCGKYIEESKKPEVTAVTFTGTCDENIRKHVSISVSRHVLHNGVVGIVGVPLEIEYDETVSEPNIYLTYDPDELRGIPQKNLIMLHYNEWSDSYDTVMNAVHDEDKCAVSADISEYGVYLLADAYQWYSCWGKDVSQYEYERRPEDYPTDWERECETGSIMELADKEWAMENAPEFHVSDKTELASVVWYVNGISEDESVSVYLEDDIDLTGYDWKPMGWTDSASKHQFSGSVFGQGHTINGMTISSDYDDTGFIGYGLNVYVEDINFTNADVSATGCTGIVGGQIYQSYEWKNISVQGKVSGGTDDYGAIVGREAYMTLTGCTADVTVDGEPFEYLSYNQKIIDEVGIVETFHLTMDEDHTVTRDEHEGFRNLGWMVEKDGVKVLHRIAEDELSYKYFGISTGEYTIYLTAYINGTYIRVSNIIQYTIN